MFAQADALLIHLKAINGVKNILSAKVQLFLPKQGDTLGLSLRWGLIDDQGTVYPRFG